MKKIFLYSLLLAVPVVIVSFANFTKKANNETAGDNGIQFIESDWNKALEQAKKEDKLIFLDAYASWCGPCKQLKRNTFTNKNAGEFFNKNFVNVAIDMEKGVGPQLLRQYPVEVYPTLIVTDKYGKLVTYTQGYINAKQLIDFGKFALKKK